MDLNKIFFIIYQGLVLGSIYGVIAIGLSLIFGITRIINLSHGALIMWGAYIAFTFFTLYNLSPLGSIFIALVVGIGLGAAIFYVILKRLIGAHELTTLLATFALSIFLQELARLRYGLDYRGYNLYMGSINIFGYGASLSALYGGILALVLTTLLTLFLYKTRLGAAIRAVAQDPVGAYVCGIDVNKIYAIGIGLGSALAMAGGVIATMYSPTGINPYYGEPYLLKSFVIVVLGGLGSVIGAYIGGLIFGLAETALFPIYDYLNFHSPSSMALFTEFVILLLLLLLRPQGLFRR
ncbi:MAG: branched-chain amino acid ABC transporter permease [Sulfolobales archaeon]